MCHASRYILPLALTLGIAPLIHIPAQTSSPQEDHHHHSKGHIPHYVITDLGGPTGPYSGSAGINNRGVVSGTYVQGLQTQAFLWTREGGYLALQNVFGATRSAASSAPNRHDLVAINFDTARTVPETDAFCNYSSAHLCFAGVWEDGSSRLLQPLLPIFYPSGNSTKSTDLNDLGEVSGYAQNGVVDPDCADRGRNRYDFLPVVWDREGEIHTLPLLKGDTVGLAFSLNNAGQVVGGTGLCTNTSMSNELEIAPFTSHAVLWDRAGHPTEIPGLGGTKIFAASINRFGEVFGGASLPGDGTSHAFLWKGPGHHTIDLGTLPGHMFSMATGSGTLNNHSEAVGASCYDINPIGEVIEDCRAFLWRDGQMYDLNKIVAPGGNPTDMALFIAYGINDRGDIVGTALVHRGGWRAFLATRVPESDEDDIH